MLRSAAASLVALTACGAEDDAVRFDIEQIDFGHVMVNGFQHEVVHLFNRSESDIHIVDYRVEQYGDDEVPFQLLWHRGIVPAGEDVAWGATFTPREVGEFGSTMIVTARSHDPEAFDEDFMEVGPYERLGDSNRLEARLTLRGRGVHGSIRTSTSELDFGRRRIGMPTETILTLENPAPYTLRGLRLDPPCNDLFSREFCVVDREEVFGLTDGTISIGAESSLDLAIRFEPIAVGLRSHAFITGPCSEDGCPFTLQAKGVGFDRAVFCRPGTVFFSKTRSGETSDAFVSCQNQSHSVVAILGARVIGDESFTLRDPPPPTELEPAEDLSDDQITFPVQYTPVEGGTHDAANLVVTFADGTVQDIQVGLTGSSFGPRFRVGTNFDGDFGELEVGAEREQSLLLWNDGTEDLSFSDVDIRQDPSGVFAFREDYERTVKPHFPQALRVVARPPGTGAFKGTMVLKTNQRDQPFEVTLTVEGI